MPWIPRRISISLDIAKGIQFLRSQNIIHPDLKGTDVLLDSKWNAKISDFGFVRTKEACRLKYEKATEISDIYRVGIIFCEIASRVVPISDEKAIEYVQQGKKECPKKFLQVIAHCLTTKREEMNRVVVVLRSMLLESSEVPGKAEYQKGTLLICTGCRKEAIPLLTRAADYDYPPAIYRMYQLTVGEKERYWKSKVAVHFKWYENKASEDPDILHMLAECYYEGLGVKKDVDRAVALFQQSANLGSIFGQVSIGWCYGQGVGVPRNRNLEVDYYRKAAQDGLCGAQVTLGYCFENGFGVTANLTAAFILYRKSAEQEHAWGLRNLGLSYKHGRGVEQDFDKAFVCFSKAAEQGLDQAINDVGLCYKYGRGVPIDLRKAASFFAKAANAGNEIAQRNLNRLLLRFPDLAA